MRRLLAWLGVSNSSVMVGPSVNASSMWVRVLTTVAVMVLFMSGGPFGSGGDGHAVGAAGAVVGVAPVVGAAGDVPGLGGVEAAGGDGPDGVDALGVGVGDADGGARVDGPVEGDEEAEPGASDGGDQRLAGVECGADGAKG